MPFEQHDNPWIDKDKNLEFDYFFVRKVITEDLEDNDVNLDTDEISRLSFSIILTDSPDSDLRCEIFVFFSSLYQKLKKRDDNDNSFCVAFWQN